MGGRRDPASRIEKFPGRVVALHIKDLAPKGENAGEDGRPMSATACFDWKRLMPVDQLTPAAIYLVIEHDNPNDFERFAAPVVSITVSASVRRRYLERDKRRHHRLRQHLRDLFHTRAALQR